MKKGEGSNYILTKKLKMILGKSQEINFLENFIKDHKSKTLSRYLNIRQ